MDNKERDNFNKNSALLLEHTKNGFTDLIELNVTLGGYYSFEIFINAKQHEIYHLCYNRSRCCQCTPGYTLPIVQVLHPSQLEYLLVKKGPTKMRHNARTTNDFCCCFAHRGLTINVLDLTLARCLLVNFCQDVFWYSCLTEKKRTLEDFLTHNKHDIYHLYDINSACCQCPLNYVFPAQRQVLTSTQWNQMFSTLCLPCPRDRKRPKGTQSICSSSVIAGITLAHLDASVSHILIEHFCQLKQSVEKLGALRNSVFGHMKDAKMSDDAYVKLRSQIEPNLLLIAETCKKESEVKQQLKDLERRTSEGTILKQIIREQLNTEDVMLTQLAEGNADIKEEITTRMKQECAKIKDEITTRMVQESAEKKDEITTMTAQHIDKRMKDMSTTLSSQVAQDTFKQQIEDEIPDGIKKMDNRSVQLYLKMIKEGTEKKRDIRVITVGKKGSGKTSLTRRLLYESMVGITSTNGIEVHVKHCCIGTKKREWMVKKGVDVDDSYESRILKHIVTPREKDKIEEQHTSAGTETVCTENDVTMTNVQNTASSVAKQDRTSREGQEDRTSSIAEKNLTPSVAEQDPISIEGERNLSSSVAEIPNISASSNDNEVTKDEIRKVLRAKINDEEFANLYLWDFAGDEDFYNTHQIFLAKDVIYLVVTKLEDWCDDMAGAFKFWFDSIHCYVKSSSKAGSDKLIDPPVIVVGTHADKFEPRSEGDNVQKCLRDQIRTLASDLKYHIRGYEILSNIPDSKDNIDGLRQKIIDIAADGRNWNLELPLKFVRLEQEMKKRFLTKVIKYDDMNALSKDIKPPITNEEELDLFLRYQHEIGTLIYFADVPDCIVLDTQWLANAFCCIISAPDFQLDLIPFDWEEFECMGRLSEELLNAIFAKQQPIIKEHKNYIVELMIKFDLLVRQRTCLDKETDKQTEDFYVPCMVKENAISDICQKFPDIKGKTHCLCLVFDFLPPVLFPQLAIACCRKVDFHSSKIVFGKKVYPTFFKNVAVFDICSNECEKLLLAKFDNVIQIQVLRFGKVKRRSYEDVHQFITQEVDRILHDRFRLNAPYKTMMKCPSTRYDSLIGLREYFTDMTTEYRCIEHSEEHEFVDDWFGKDRPKEINKEQMNYTRIGMITLDVLSDVLYDLLKIDTPVVQQRENYDISKLYDKHRRLNKHVPTKGWGGGTVAEYIHPQFKQTGDDIERIRLIRNEMQHSSEYSMPEKRCNELFDIIKDLLQRFDSHVNYYSTRAEEIKQITYTRNDREDLKEKLSQVSEYHQYHAEHLHVHHHHYHK